MKPKLLIRIIPVMFVLAGIEVLACLVNTVVGIVCGILLAVFSELLLKFFALAVEREWIHLAIPVLSSVAGICVLTVGRGESWMGPLWFAPMIAFITALLWRFTAIRRSRRCALCDRRLAGVMCFSCPRCHLLACERCWTFEHLRCKLCEQNQVPLPWLGEQWWSSNFGPISRRGRCEYCKQSAEGVDTNTTPPNLRACRHCGRFQCQQCWDYLNGQCTRCGGIVPDLPEELRILMAPPYSVSSSKSDTARYA